MHDQHHKLQFYLWANEVNPGLPWKSSWNKIQAVTWISVSLRQNETRILICLWTDWWVRGRVEWVWGKLAKKTNIRLNSLADLFDQRKHL